MSPKFERVANRLRVASEPDPIVRPPSMVQTRHPVESGEEAEWPMAASASALAGSHETITHRLQRYSVDRDSKIALRWLHEDGHTAESWTFSELYRNAAHIASRLISRWGAKPRDRALLVYYPGLPFAAAFMGCLHANVTAVPVYPPSPSNAAPGLQKLALQMRAAQPMLALTERAFSRLRPLLALQHVNMPR